MPMHTVSAVNPDTQAYELYHDGNRGESPSKTFSKRNALTLMWDIAASYGIRFGDPCCPCKDRLPQKFDRYGNRWHLVEEHCE